MTSTSSCSFCCCTGLFRKKQAPEDIQIKVNGVNHLKVPTVHLNGNGVGHGGSPIESPIRLEEFHTARMPVSPVRPNVQKTHNDEAEEKKFFSMKELMRIVRLEEGLHVTPREPSQIGVVMEKAQSKL